MAVTAYVSLVSLTHVLDNVQHPARRHRLHLDMNRIQSLQDKVQFLQGFLEVHSQRKSQEMEDLTSQITDVANDAENIIDLHVVDQLREGSQDESHHLAALLSFCQDMDKIIQKINSITEHLMMIQEEWSDDVQEQNPAVFGHARSTTLPSGGNNTMVGFDEHLLQVIDELTKDESNLSILPIVGMGGIGKTTLAQNTFDHPYIVNHFDIRIWFTISQTYSVEEILQGLLSDGKTQKSGGTLARLGEQLHKKLFGRRYLIVMDDVWSTKVWDELSLFFPNNGKGSRIMMTTRMSEVVVSLGCNTPYLMNFLNEEESWNLFCVKVFGQKVCTYPELEKIGKEIARACGGLPIAIVAIAGHLANSNMQQEYWKSVAKNVNAFANSQYNEHCLKILSLSYNYLPMYLKPCFLYMSTFSEDYQIKVSELINLWISEGFIKSVRGKMLEEIANGYLEDLVGRNLILVRERSLRGKIKCCSIHDLLRDLCLREFDKEHFVYTGKIHHDGFKRLSLGIRLMNDVCFLCTNWEPQEMIDLPEVLVGSLSTSVASLPVCEACKIRNPNITKLRLARVAKEFGMNLLEPTKLRYIFAIPALGINFNSTSIHLLWNLESLLLQNFASGHHNPQVLPYEIWEMPQLRRLKFQLGLLPDPIVTQDSTILENLHTLSGILNFKITKKVLEIIPNLKKLKVYYSVINQEKWSDYCLEDLVYLHKLESLSLSCFFLKSKYINFPKGLSWADYILPENIAFPSSLKKLNLEGGNIPWENMTVIGSLPNLEVLKLSFHAFEGPEWNPEEGQFSRLKVLYIRESNLVWWRAESSHFPNLERLFLIDMAHLEEIPSEIGDIVTLGSIYLDRCSHSATISAQEIEQEQHSNGNELQVRIQQ
ncbi:putative late blight resistance proteinR1A-10 [Sesamum alatum]|uniref:Late blight resistance proteinR1A-10 n=1 Tax=Sesamum alatum TaxID=300844 RepID=A0AAE1YVG2_9LAMI|nr:putative late blight resistance proteinR1A-10 [Sesamum alatum]